MNGRFWILIPILTVAMLSGCGKAGHEHTTTVATAKYHCPMHPSVVSDKPGDCPICGMKLVTMEEGKAEATSPGRAAVSITPEVRQRMGLTLGKVERRPMVREIRTSARIVADETRLYHVTVKVDGYVEHFHEIATGKFIQKGEPLLRIYSPMLVSAQQEYLTALDSGSTNLIADARRRLELWDVPEEQITNLERTRQVEKTLTLVAPFTGWVIERGISAGHKVMTGEPLLVLADLRSVWAEADIYEMDLPYVSTGMVAELSFPHGRDKTFAGKVTLLAPTVDLESRTVKARMEIANPDLLLKPGMYATARLRGDLGEKLAIPETAVMRTGERTYAFKDAGDGRLAPVEIKVGAPADGWFELLDGLNEGDQVVTSANFLVDSESSMKAALAGMSGHQH